MEISKQQFLKACQDKQMQDQSDADALVEQQLDEAFAEEVASLPIDCQSDFVYNGNLYSIDFVNRRFLRTSTSNNNNGNNNGNNNNTLIKDLFDGRLRSADRSFSGSGTILNQQLGI